MKIPVLVFFTVTALFASDIKPLTGQMYRELPESARIGFASGYLTGYVTAGATARRTVTDALVANGFKILSEDINQKFNCPHGLFLTINYGQAHAILDKYVADHPESWDKPIGQLAEEAFIDACEKRAKNP